MSTITVTPNEELKNLQAEHASELSKADGFIAAIERQKRRPTNAEQEIINVSLRRTGELQTKIDAAKAKAAPTIPSTAEARAALAKYGRFTDPTAAPKRTGVDLMPNRFSRDYYHAFYGYIGGGGPLNAALYEGTSAAGGYAVPVEVAGQVVPLAPQDSAVRRLARVVPTKSDLKVTQAVTRGLFAAKTETSGFSVAQPSVSQFTLSAFPAGVETQISLELAQDADYFRAFVLDDMVTGLLEYEEPLFISGTGSGQPQGLLGNVGAGVTAEPDSGGNLVSVQATLNVLSTLKETYHSDASWLMQRATSLIIRAAQLNSGVFEGVFRRENSVDHLHGYPCAYSSAMPTAARGATPVLFGSFRRGYVIGDRGGSAMIVKIIEQDMTLAQQGMIALLGYRRTDGRVMRSEAIQGITVAAS